MRGTHADGEERDGLVDSSERRDVDGLSSDGTLRTDSGRVLSGSGVDDGVDEDLDGVLLSDEVDDLESVLHDSDGHELLAVVSAVHHEPVRELVARDGEELFDARVDQSLDDRHSSLGELLLGISASGVGDVDGVVDVDVVGERDVLDLDPGG